MEKPVITPEIAEKLEGKPDNLINLERRNSMKMFSDIRYKDMRT